MLKQRLAKIDEGPLISRRPQSCLPRRTTHINGCSRTPLLTLEVMALCGKRGRKRAGRNDKMSLQAILGN
jgi:hypothetical protein